jgi:hypothetical protein
MNDTASPVSIVPIDDPTAPVIFADQLIGAGPMGANTGVANLTFAVQLWDHSVNPPRPYLKTCLRVVMPVEKLKQAMEFTDQTISKPNTDWEGRAAVRLN